ncbi:LytTR family DNA-binding domain-containing protein [Acetobacter senegalensis]|uniref:LytTR family DNA-binding domain-containing protein n=2 Tax=Acetobacter senegalensis TaxID=446692 RepID=UPI00128AED19|nr:LytTR family DNA-binding domain-containing protein [Acetobacter senegalensis]MCG4257694.1 LytTR family transcriptional regulator DNA-binding domain-containing protein [Acetobacter senegalensis]MCG4267760.1 LytTR family transcriptional regulator DNA-binding domain-containing protein [Acetobacter senegalensis]MPQ74790.1 LytTR family transcriptional regulator [Acetobacter senegalensis]
MTEIVIPLMLRSRRVRLALITTGAGLCLGLLAPFGSYLNSGLIWRLLYWSGSIWFGLLLFGGLWLVWEKQAARLKQARWPVLAAMFAVASLVQASITRITAFLIWPELHRSAPAWSVWYLQSGLITATGFAFFFLLKRRSTKSIPPTTSGAIIKGGSVRSIPLSKDVLALQMEDHYVRIHTRTGSQLMQMTLTEAIDAVGSIEGLRTHRSWWVAREAVRWIEGSSRSMRLHLEGDIVAPVARGTVAVLREAGWLKAVE